MTGNVYHSALYKLTHSTVPPRQHPPMLLGLSNHDDSFCGSSIFFTELGHIDFLQYCTCNPRIESSVVARLYNKLDVHKSSVSDILALSLVREYKNIYHYLCLLKSTHINQLHFTVQKKNVLRTYVRINFYARYGLTLFGLI